MVRGEAAEIILAIIQARMSSSRLPGKVLLPIGGKPILHWVIQAAKQAKLVDEVIVATSYNTEDERIVDYAAGYVEVFPGELEDVLGRFYEAALLYQPLHIVRLTADCPMGNPEIIDATIRLHLREGNDYTTNSGFPGCFPDGQDVEVFTMETLTRMAKLATLPHDREHVTPFMRESGLFKVGMLQCTDPTDKKYSVDTREDYERVKEEMEKCLPAQKPCLRVL
jgi:spore coat polysaccharide biosynthesis protein SpsF (cytidylyltransferase family)